MSPDVERYELVLKRLIAVTEAETSMLAFTRLMMPVPAHPDDPDFSRYEAQRFHRVICVALEELEKGEKFRRLIINLPPRHGKTELASKKFLAWVVGRNPAKSTIFGTYNEKFSQDIGRAVRDIMLSQPYAQVFPNTVLKSDSKASDRLETTAGGILAFVGRGGTTTGRGGDLLVIDDPIKDRMEADSPTIRDTLWTWFTQVIASRLMDETGRILLIQTRWHQDDLIGRLTDPHNSYYDPMEAHDWRIIDLPALAAEDKDPLKRQVGDALWPSRFGKEYLESLQRRDVRGFSALYQGRPSPAGGTFFSVDWLHTYRPNDLPDNLRHYAASDHAVALKQGSDKTCLMVIGVDSQDNIWVLADLIWRHMTAEQTTESMLRMMKLHRPLFWWAERGHISKSIGPFLRKRMLETHTFCSLIEMQPIADKQTRAQSIQGRLSMGKVRFPERAPWWPAARDQMLKFPYDAHDDFVDTLAYIGLGLTLQVPMGERRDSDADQPSENTFAYLKLQRDQAERSVRLGYGAGGW
jgi:predicted phage terminase large subunit-like protein